MVVNLYLVDKNMMWVSVLEVSVGLELEKVLIQFLREQGRIIHIV